MIDAYVLLQQSLGMRFESARTLLRQFSREMGNPRIEEVEAATRRRIPSRIGPLSATWTLKYRVLSGFYRFAISRGYVDSSPLPTSQPKLPPQQSPYIYSTDELRRLLDATSALRVANSRLKAMYRTLLMLLYGAGLRVGEALSLTLRDVDLAERIITVRNTKFFKTRLVPIGPKLTRELAAHIQRRGSFRCPQVRIHRYSPRARASGGPTSMSSGCSSMSDERPGSAALPARVALHGCTIFATLPPCTGSSRGIAPGRMSSGCCRNSRPTSATSISDRPSAICK